MHIHTRLQNINHSQALFIVKRQYTKITPYRIACKGASIPIEGVCTLLLPLQRATANNPKLTFYLGQVAQSRDAGAKITGIFATQRAVF